VLSLNSAEPEHAAVDQVVLSLNSAEPEHAAVDQVVLSLNSKQRLAEGGSGLGCSPNRAAQQALASVRQGHAGFADTVNQRVAQCMLVAPGTGDHMPGLTIFNTSRQS
jgi:hypothetical protein